MTSPATTGRTTGDADSAPARRAPKGPFQLLAYFLVALALHRAAKQVRLRADARSRIADGDDGRLDRYAADIVAARTEAEQRLQGLTFAMPREDIAAALTDAVAWCDDSVIARQALDRLIDHYEVDYGLIVGRTGLTLDVDPDYEVDYMQAAMSNSAIFFRQEAAALHITAALTAAPVSEQTRAEVTGLVSDWVGPRAVDANLTPDALDAGRTRLQHRLDDTGLSPSDKAQLLFDVDYLTGRAGTASGVDLLSTSTWDPVPPTPPSVPAPVYPPPTTTPADPGFEAATPPPPRVLSPIPPTGAVGEAGPAPDMLSAPAPAHDNGRAAPRPDTGGRFPARGDRRAPPAFPPAASPPPAPAPVPVPPPPAPVTGPAPQLGHSATGTAVDGARLRIEVHRLITEYLDNTRSAHGYAQALAGDLNAPITTEWLTLADNLRAQRHQLLSIAWHEPALADIERIQIQAILYDADTGNTSAPPLIWIGDDFKRAADRNLLAEQARDLRTATVDKVNKILAEAGALQKPQPETRLPEPIRRTVRTLIEAATADDAATEGYTRFTAAAAELGTQLSAAGVGEDLRTTISNFVQSDQFAAHDAIRPSRVFKRLAHLLDGTGVLADLPPQPATDHGLIRGIVGSLGDTIEAVAGNARNLDGLRRRYSAALDSLLGHLATAGVPKSVCDDVGGTIRTQAELATAHARRSRDRSTKWAERSATHSPPAAGPANSGHHVTSDRRDTHHTPARPMAPEQRRQQYWRAQTRHRVDAAPTARR
ncbi:hypothetical protein [Nocardia sp. alder85J]|uniref:hypothetical protein n=1 Tax=Nocardia sp. alder85J TaxID=2862949 RepID=UPI001CD7A373|nr:hypothetical protein [Nocardia sp. alder85J]MCX4097705.1 hypothetical protein [Nocardia sp. alder85J]